jgi:hypothetical protein
MSDQRLANIRARAADPKHSTWPRLMTHRIGQARLDIDSLLGEIDHQPSLDAAWAEAEAVLPEGWEIIELRNGAVWHAAAFGIIPVPDMPGLITGERLEDDGPTPAAALRALAAKLREVGR